MVDVAGCVPEPSTENPDVSDVSDVSHRSSPMNFFLELHKRMITPGLVGTFGRRVVTNGSLMDLTYIGLRTSVKGSASSRVQLIA